MGFLKARLSCLKNKTINMKRYYTQIKNLLSSLIIDIIKTFSCFLLFSDQDCYKLVPTTEIIDSYSDNTETDSNLNITAIWYVLKPVCLKLFKPIIGFLSKK